MFNLTIKSRYTSMTRTMNMFHLCKSPMLRNLAQQTTRTMCHHGHSNGNHDCAPNASDFIRAGNRSGKEFAFEMTFSTVRFGMGATQEIGQDLQMMNAARTLIITDNRVATTPAFDAVANSCQKHGIIFDVYDQVKVEPTNVSVQKYPVSYFIQHAINHSINGRYDSFVAVGGGSAIDTAKCAALFTNNKQNSLWDFASAPLGKEKHPANRMLPLIAVPTTAGTGSETTCTAIFDHDEKRVKSGIRHRFIKPHLAIVDPLNVMSMPRHVTIYSGFDVLCHALESFTARPYIDRPAVDHPSNRPVYQGSNPISDVWCQQALKLMHDNLETSVNDPENVSARAGMMLAACYAGVGFGNAGTHLPHGLSYPISGKVKTFKSLDYEDASEHALIPHGLSVVLTAPAVFEYTWSACEQRHQRAAQLLGAEHVDKFKGADVGRLLGERLRLLMQKLKVPNGLKAVNYSGEEDMSMLSELALLSKSAIRLSPREPDREALQRIYENSQVVY